MTLMLGNHLLIHKAFVHIKVTIPFAMLPVFFISVNITIIDSVQIHWDNYLLFVKY